MAGGLPAGTRVSDIPTAVPPKVDTRPAALLNALAGAGQTGGAVVTDEQALQSKIEATNGLIAEAQNKLAELEKIRLNPALLPKGLSLTDLGRQIAQWTVALAERKAQLSKQSEELARLIASKMPKETQRPRVPVTEAATPAEPVYGPFASEAGMAAPQPKKTSVSSVVEELKKEEAKGGPGLFDILEAASAGWGGRKSQYSSRQEKEKEAKTEMERLVKATELQAAAQARASADELKNQMALLNKKAQLENTLATPTIPGLDPITQNLMNQYGIGGK